MASVGTAPAAARGRPTRNRAYEIADNLRRSGSIEYSLIREMVGLLAEDARQRLVDAQQSDMLGVQGEARAFEKLYRRLTEAPPNQE